MWFHPPSESVVLLIAILGSVGIITKDPIVDPGMMYSNHTHMGEFQRTRPFLTLTLYSTVAGSSAFDSTITTAKLRAAGTCTTVPISQDHSNYWVPVGVTLS